MGFGSGHSHGDSASGPHSIPAPLPPSQRTFTNSLLPEVGWPGPMGVQYTDMDFRSLENSRVHSFFISCLMTWREMPAFRVRQERRRAW